MNEVTYGGAEPTAARDAGMPPAPQMLAPASTQELAQLILMGMQQDIQAQIDWRLQQAAPSRRTISGPELGLILGSVGLAVPLTAIAAAGAGLAGILAVWIGLVLINVAWSQRR